METVSHIIPLHRRILLCRVVFSFIFLFLVYAFISNTAFHQLRSPVLKYPYVDPLYWLMHWLQIPDIIVSNNSVAWIFDVLLFASCLLCIVFPLQRIFIVVFLISYFIYFITYNSYGAHHTHGEVGILLAPVPFLFRKELTFSFLLEGLRYYILFIFSSAFLWKLFRLSFLQDDHGVWIVKNNLASYLYFHPGTFFGNCYRWMLQHPSFTNTMYIAGIIAEALFIVGFFTRRYDKYLLVLFILLVTGFWFMADAFFVPLLVLAPTLVNFNATRSDSSV